MTSKLNKVDFVACVVLLERSHPSAAVSIVRARRKYVTALSKLTQFVYMTDRNEYTFQPDTLTSRAHVLQPYAPSVAL
jgi:hypothetical protein